MTLFLSKNFLIFHFHSTLLIPSPVALGLNHRLLKKTNKTVQVWTLLASPSSFLATHILSIRVKLSQFHFSLFLVSGVLYLLLTKPTLCFDLVRFYLSFRTRLGITSHPKAVR